MKSYTIQLKGRYLHGITTDGKAEPVFTRSQQWAYKFMSKEEAKAVKKQHIELKQFKIV